MNKKLLTLVLIIISVSTFGQNSKKNAITFNGSTGLSNSQIMNGNNETYRPLTKPGNFYSFGGEFSKLVKRFEFGIQLNVSKSQLSEYLILDYRYILDSISTSGSNIIIYDTIFYMGLKATFTNSYFTIQVAPNVNFYWLQKDQYKFYSSLQLGFNNVFRDTYRADVTYEKVYNNIDTTYINTNLKYMRTVNFSARVATGALFQLSEKFYLKSELFYESKLYSIYKNNPSETNKTWTRYYNYGLNLGIRYCF